MSPGARACVALKEPQGKGRVPPVHMCMRRMVDPRPVMHLNLGGRRTFVNDGSAL